jgi:hypothetical protein
MATKAKRVKPARFTWEIPGDQDAKVALNAKLHRIKEIMLQRLNRPVNNYEVMDKLLDSWLEENNPSSGMAYSSYHEVVDDEKEDIFVATASSVHRLAEMAAAHAMHCSAPVKQTKLTKRGHVAVIKLKCSNNKAHTYTWSSSPYLKNKQFLVNARVAHGFVTSGLLPVQYERLCLGAKFGHLGLRKRKALLQHHAQCINEEYEDSIDAALAKEKDLSNAERENGITVMSDARHSCRRNAKDTSVVIIGDKSHKVLQHQLVTKADDPVTQRHETVGTKKVLDNFQEKNIAIHMWIHDRNVSINKELRVRGIMNQNDMWHAIKPVKKSLRKVGDGPKKNHGKTWHHELDDKMNSIANHFHYAARDSKGDAETLRTKLDNVVKHYKNVHSICPEVSRCKKDEKYEPTKKVITDTIAEKLLSQTIHSSTIYKNAQDYAHGKDTHYVESFNNVLNIYQDKRISFSSIDYEIRSKLATMHWNENVDRGYTSEWHAPSSANRRAKTKKIYEKVTYHYKDKLWHRYLAKIN